MRKYIYSLTPILLIGVFAVSFSACIPQQAATAEPATTTSSDELTEKSGFTTLSGTLSQQGANYTLQTTTGPVMLKSFEVDLSTYVGTSVTVTGKYSGDELFVSEIE